MPVILTSVAHDSRWWRDGDALRRFVVSLVGAEIGSMRPGRGEPAAAGRPCVEADIGAVFPTLDSLERLQLSSAVSEALHLYDSGLEDHLLTLPAFEDWLVFAERSLGHFSAALTFRTSGSSGVPKACPHRLAELEREVEALRGIVPEEERILAAVPCHHIYGFLLTVLLPRHLGSVPVIDIRDRSPGAVLALARPGDVIVGHPAFWAAIARGAPAAWPPGVTGVTSTAPCPTTTAEALRKAGLSRLVQIHGSSETGGLGWRDDPDGPYSLLPYLHRTATGQELQRLALDGVAPATPVAVVDVLEWLDDRHYHVLRRQDGAVQVGGTNVFPRRVQEVLLTHPDVADASVRLMVPAEGVRLKAFIVPRQLHADTDMLRIALGRLADSCLAVAERPRAYTFGRQLPVGPMDKPADWSIVPL